MGVFGVGLERVDGGRDRMGWITWMEWSRGSECMYLWSGCMVRKRDRK